MNAMFRIFFIITLGLQNKFLQDVVVPRDNTVVNINMSKKVALGYVTVQT